MVGRKGEAYLGGHTIWPKNVGGSDANDLALKRKRRKKQLERQKKARLRKKELTIVSTIGHPRSKPRIKIALPDDFKYEKEIGFLGNLPSIYFNTVKAALVRAKNDGLQTDDEIANYWNAIGFRTATGKKWLGRFVTAAHNKIKLPKSRKKSHNRQRRGIRLTGRILSQI